MNRSLPLLVAMAGILTAGSALAQSTTSDPLGINAIDEPTITQLRGAVGQTTFSTLPKNQRSVWDNGTFRDMNLDGEIDQ